MFQNWTPRWPSGQGVRLGSGRSGVRIPLATGLFRVESYQWLQKWHSSGYPARRLALQGQRWDWSARCQYTVTGWGRKFDPATSISVWQYVKLSVQICPWDPPACWWDVKQPTNKQFQNWTALNTHIPYGELSPDLTVSWPNKRKGRYTADIPCFHFACLHLHLHIGFVHPLQDVNFHQCLPLSFVAFLFQVVPSFLAITVVLVVLLISSLSLVALCSVKSTYCTSVLLYVQPISTFVSVCIL